MNARVLEAKRLLLGGGRLEIYLEEREDGHWNIRFGRGTGEHLHLSQSSLPADGTTPPTLMPLSDLLYKAEMFDHMVEHLQDQIARADETSTAPEDPTRQLATLAEVGVCTQGLSNEALEAMSHEFFSENYSDATLEEIAAWARDILAIRRSHSQHTAPVPDLLRF